MMNSNPKSNSDQHFERWSDTYERSFMQWLIFDRVHRILLDLVPGDFQPQSILDVGCGTGRLLRKAAARWPAAQLTGVDPANGMIVKARESTPAATFYVSPSETLPLPDTSVDLVFSTVSFHHWEDQREGVRQVARVLRPRGYFYLADFWPAFHGKFARPPFLRELFAQAGLQTHLQRWALGRFLLITVGEKIG
jgi:ubiquinone/menaquinone biosynthesis C-methylase UbiE